MKAKGLKYQGSAQSVMIAQIMKRNGSKLDRKEDLEKILQGESLKFQKSMKKGSNTARSTIDIHSTHISPPDVLGIFTRNLAG